MTKKELRELCLNKRKALSADKKRALDMEIQSRLLMTQEYRKSDTVLIYVSNEYEIDTFGIINAAFANKKKVAVPVTNEDYSLSFYYINSLKELKRGRFNILEPIDRTKKVEVFDNSICVVPALCCDLEGNRVGYGKGCYDRFLSTYSGCSLCLVYGDDILPQIESENTDEQVDVIISDLYIKLT
ncbi:MAG: 5-formyltetrahydrofolate cyclo-ligase [Ruminococcus sp.]|nr:5-formyltetrahydrofolate cyclo-ligase [Ruminococcus sp.]